MFRNVRVVSIVVTLLAIIVLNVGANATQAFADDPGISCFDLWADCLNSGHSQDYCSDFWCACMRAGGGDEPPCAAALF